MSRRMKRTKEDVDNDKSSEEEEGKVDKRRLLKDLLRVLNKDLR